MRAEIAEELASLGFFDEASLKQESALINAISTRTYQAGEVIYHSGEPSSVLFVVRAGMLKLLAYLPNGRSRIVRLHKRASLLGLDGLMGKPHEHTAVAIDEVSVFQIPHSEMQSWQARVPELNMKLLEKWQEYLNYADTWITDFSVGSIKGRVARLILFLARFDAQTGPQVVELLTTEEMAEMLGVTPESVSRVVAEFKRQKILQEIENNAEPLFTCDQARLEALSRS